MRKSEYEDLKKIFESNKMLILKVDSLKSKIGMEKRVGFSECKILATIADYQSQCKHKNFQKPINNTSESIMDIIRELSGSRRAFNQNYQVILARKKKLAAVCSRELKRSLSKTSKINPMLKSKKINKELMNFDKRIKKSLGILSKLEEKQAAVEKRKLEELEEENRQKRKFNYLLNQTEAFANYFLNRISKTEGGIEGICAAKRQLESTREFDQGKKTKKMHDGELVAEIAGEEIEVYVHTNVLQPKILKGTLKEHQLKGLNWLVSLYNQGINGILADDMGLGKTVQSLSLLGYLYETKGISGPFLIISPTSTLHNWAQEFETFLPEFKVVEYWGTINDRKNARKKIKNCNAIITSYQLALSDENYLKKIRFQYMILDEAQAIKSNTSLRWKSLLKFKSRNRLLLTGTPIQNTMTELWALLHFIMPTLFDSVSEFSEWFSKEIENKKIDDVQIQKLHTILKPFMLRRYKSDIKSELGNKEIVHVYCDLSIRQQILYDEIVNSKLDYENIMMHLKKVCNHPDLFEKLEPHSNLYIPLVHSNNLIERRAIHKIILPEYIIRTDDTIKTIISEYKVKESSLNDNFSIKFFSNLLSESQLQINYKNQPTEIFHIIEANYQFDNMLKNRFIFRAEKCHLDYFNSNITNLNTIKINPEDMIQTYPLNTFINNSGKLKVLDDLLVQLNKGNHRVLIYFQMTRMMDLFEEFLIEKQYSYLRLDGTCKVSQRKELVNLWQNTDRHFIFMLSTRAGGVGLNLTAADTVIFYDSDWNPTVDQQAMDRVYRLGQTKDVTVYRLITKGTIEERIMEMAEKKGEMQKLVIKEDVFKI